MSDPVEYMALTVIGADTAEALAWLRRRQRWERRLDDLHTPAPARADEVDHPPSAA
jgi:hypothetical protein